MTREEAKEIFLNRGYIDGVYNGNKWREACIVLSEWLEQEPTAKNDLVVDCINRQATINAVKRIHPVDTDYDCTLYDKVDVMYVLNNMPSVTPQEPKIKVLDHDEVARKLGTVDIYKASAWITLLKDLEYLGMKICEVEE